MNQTVDNRRYGYVYINTGSESNVVVEAVAKDVSNVTVGKTLPYTARVAWTGLLLEEIVPGHAFDVIAYVVYTDPSSFDALMLKIDEEVEKHNTIKFVEEGKTYGKGAYAPHNTNTRLDKH